MNRETTNKGTDSLTNKHFRYGEKMGNKYMNVRNNTSKSSKSKEVYTSTKTKGRKRGGNNKDRRRKITQVEVVKIKKYT